MCLDGWFLHVQWQNNIKVQPIAILFGIACMTCSGHCSIIAGCAKQKHLAAVKKGTATAKQSKINTMTELHLIWPVRTGTDIKL